jgi:phosphatidylglycerophosphate synthase
MWMKNAMKQLANGITISRIAASFLLLTTTPFSLMFYVVYIYCGLSDMIDGTIARKSGNTSKAGANLDSIADAVFVIICMIKILPMIRCKIWMWIWIGSIVLIKIMNLTSALIYLKKPVFLHTIANKITGFFLFIWLLTVKGIPMQITVPVVCAVATFAAVQEGYFIRTGNMGVIELL